MVAKGEGNIMELDEIERHIGKQMKMLRMANKISQKQLAKTMGVTYQQVQKYENGLNRISVSRLWQICHIFDISPDFLFEGTLGDSRISGKKKAELIPNTLATSQDIKMMLAFKNIEETSKRALMIKVCRAMGPGPSSDI